MVDSGSQGNLNSQLKKPESSRIKFVLSSTFQKNKHNVFTSLILDTTNLSNIFSMIADKTLSERDLVYINLNSLIF